MADAPKWQWTGGSGKGYTYFVYSLPFSCKAAQDGNYIYAKQDAAGGWVPIYIGEGDLNDRAGNHHQHACITQKGATHFHCHLQASKDARRAEEADLLAGHPSAYQPTGCNERAGG